jgi:hypothetical protein
MRSQIPGFPWTPNSDENAKEKSMKAMKAVTLTLSLALGLVATVSGAQTSREDSPSLRETLDYINSKFMNADNSEHGRVSVSDDHETIITAVDTDKPRAYVHYSAPVVGVDALTPKAVMEITGYSITLSCKNNDLCFTRTIHAPNLGDKKARTFQDNVALFDWAFPFDREQAQRLVRAFTHLIDLLQTEFRAKHADKTDPFAK